MAVPILKERPITTREALIPYLMTGLNLLAPTLVARDILYPQVYLVSIILILTGLPFSIFFRQRQYSRITLNILFTIALLILTWSMVHTHPGLQIDWDNPIATFLTLDSIEALMGLLHVFIPLAAGRAFLLVTSRDVLQTPLPSISIFLLAIVADRPDASSGRLTFIIFCLLLLLASSLYLLCQEHSQQWFTIHTPLRLQQRLVIWSFLFTLLLLPPIIYLGQGMRQFNLTNMALRRGHTQNLRMPNFLRGNYGIGLSDTLEVGGGNWPGGKQLIMTVTVDEKAPQNLLWRGGTYADYDARASSWQLDAPVPGYDSRIPTPPTPELGTDWYRMALQPTTKLGFFVNRPLVDPGIRAAIAEGKIDLNDPEVVVTQHVKIQVPPVYTSTPIYGAYHIADITSQDSNFQRTAPGQDGSFYILGAYPQMTLKPYDVKSIIKPTPVTLKLQTPIALSQYDHIRYLQMPGSEYKQQIAEKAREILQKRGVKESASAYDRMRAIELFLGQNYQYTLKPSPPKRQSDPIIDFLYYQKKGYCVYFAGSMVMLCRSIGIPARLVSGFATGDQPEHPSGDGKVVYQVTSEHAHAWVEVFLPQYGWYTVDPTAGSTEAPTVWGTTWDTFVEIVTAVKTFFQEWRTAYQEQALIRGYIHLGLAALLVLIAAVIYFRRERPPVQPKRPLSDDEAKRIILQVYQRLHRWLRMWGVIKPQGLTAREFEQQFSAINAPMGALVCEISALYLRVRYGDGTASDADARKAIELMQELWDVARVERKNLQAPTQEVGTDA